MERIVILFLVFAHPQKSVKLLRTVIWILSDQVSISSTFYKRILGGYFGAKNYKAEMLLDNAARSIFVQNLRLKCWWN